MIKQIDDCSILLSSIPKQNYADTCTISIIVNYQNKVVESFVSTHDGADDQLIKFNQDGYYKIYTLVIPTLEGIEHQEWDKNGKFYYYDKGKVYKVTLKGTIQVELMDLLDIADFDEYFSLCNLKSKTDKFSKMLLNVAQYYINCKDWENAQRIISYNTEEIKNGKCCCCI